jgi:GTP-binding protein
MALLQHATFVTSATAAAHLPRDSHVEVAVAGRSNAGKSSAINTLAGRHRLAFVSKTPGRTQEINYFRLAEGKYLVDLPGYGYARVPAEIKQRWQAFLGEFLRSRAQLAGLILIMDARHPVTELDLRLLEWFAPTGKPLHVLLTKADKLTRRAASKALAGVRQFLEEHYPGYTAQLFSSVDRSGLEEAERVIAEWLGLAQETKSPRLKGSKTGGTTP